MKLSIALSSLLLSAASAAAYEPVRVSYDSLLVAPSREEQGKNISNKNNFLRALQEVGMVSITGVPSFNKQIVMVEALSPCINEVGVEFIFGTDQTVRRTIASHSLAAVAEPLLFEATSSCDALEQSSGAFRQTVQHVVEAFAKHLSALLDLDQEQLLQSRHDGSTSSTSETPALTLTEVINQGDHLEHFHSYHKKNAGGVEIDNETIDYHIDQGILLAFTPGISLKDGKTTGGFNIQLANGRSEEVHFDIEQDDIVFFLGDGINQIVNDHLKSGEQPLRALPHSLELTSNMEERVWYGRMVLAPSNAIHPLHPTKTFGDIRDSMIQQHQSTSSVESDDSILAIGCSSTRVARMLQNETACIDGLQDYCWHRCMNYTDYDASPALCEGRNLAYGCIAEGGELWGGEEHNPIFEIRCAAEIKNSTDGDGGGNGDHNGHSHGSSDDEDSGTLQLSIAAAAIFSAVAAMLV